MRRLTPAYLLAALVMLSPTLAQAEPQDVTLTCVRQDHQFTLKMGLGKYTAVHFLPHPDQADATKAVQEYFDKAPTLAGVYHIFVSSGDGAALKTWASQFKDQDLMIALDPKGDLANECKLAEKVTKQGLPATVVLDPQGHELFRRESTGATDYLRFADFGKLLDQKWKANTGEYNLPKGQNVALDGYDPVAYFGPGATKGRPEILSEYRGVKYQFSTIDNRRLFAEDPERYLPTYGGWCATAMGKKGEKVEVDPTDFKVTHGRLFLFYKGLLADAKKDWDKHEKEWEPAADRYWKGFSGEEPIKPVEKK